MPVSYTHLIPKPAEITVFHGKPAQLTPASAIITATQDKAFLNLSLIHISSYGQLAENLLLQCLVRTVTAQEGIESMQITVNGEIAAQTASGIDISLPLTADTPLNQVSSN